MHVRVDCLWNFEMQKPNARVIEHTLVDLIVEILVVVYFLISHIILQQLMSENYVHVMNEGKDPGYGRRDSKGSVVDLRIWISSGIL